MLHLPQIALRSHSKILRTTSETTLEQVFSNTSKESIKKCIYTFPLYDGISIVSFECHLGDRILTGNVQEKRKAKAVYDKAVARGETAGLLEQLPQASDVFSTRLGNIEAGGEVVVKITYVGELKHDAEVDGIRLTLPTSIAPRYGGEPYVALRGKSAQAKGGISVVVDVDVGESSSIQSLQSPSHPIAVTLGKTSTTSDEVPVMHKASATLALGSAQLDDDFVLMISNKDNGTPTAFLETHPDIPNQRALMVDLVPKFSLPPGRPEIIFVADRSGSMGHQIPTLIAALQVFLKSLPLGVKFNICSFGSRYTFLWPKSRAYDNDSLKEAISHVQGFRANYGGTETYAALKGSIEKRFGDLDCEILLLTDGDIWRQEELFDYLNRTVGKSIRVFTLGIGGGVSSALIEGVAHAGKGFAQMVGEGEKLDKKLIRMLKGALSPHISDYSMEIRYESDEGDDMSWEVVEKVIDSLRVMTTETEQQQGRNSQKTQEPISLFDSSLKTEDTISDRNEESYTNLPDIQVPKLLQAPHDIPPLFPFMRTTAYLLMSPETVQKNPKSVILRGTSPQGPLELEIIVQKSATASKKIHQLAARKAMQELEEGRGWLSDAKTSDGTLLKTSHPSCFDEMVQREAIRLGVQFQVGGKWCSFVAVSEDGEQLERVEAKEEPLRKRCRAPPRSYYSSVAPKMALSSSLGSSNPALKRRQSPLPQLTGPTEPLEADESSGDEGYGCLDAAPDPNPPQQRSQAAMSGSSNYSANNLGLAGTHSSLSHQGGGAPRGDHRGGHGALRQQGTKSPSTSPSAALPVGLFGATGSRSCLDPQSMTESDKVHAIINLQNFEGHWEAGNELFRIMDLNDRAQKSKTLVETTLLVVVFLEQKMAGEKDVWELVVEKARAWLQNANIGADAMEKMAID